MNERRQGQIDVLQRLRAAIGEETQKEWADKHGISPQYLSHVLSGRTDPGPKILAALGLKRVVVYQRGEAA